MLLVTSQYLLPMNSVVKGFRTFQKPPLPHFIKHLLKMELSKHRVKGHPREQSPTPNKMIPAQGSLEDKVVTKNPSRLLSSSEHWTLRNTLELTGNHNVFLECEHLRNILLALLLMCCVNISKPALCITTWKTDPALFLIVGNWRDPSTRSYTLHVMCNHWGTACISSLTNSN